MKKTINSPVKVYSDPVHEEKTRKELYSAKLLMQQLIDEWYFLNIGEFADLNELLRRPERAYNNAIDRLVTPPDYGGKFAINKAKFLEGLELPDPTRLYMTAKATRQQPHCLSSELWSVTERIIILNEAEAESLIDSQSIYATTPEQVAAVEAVIQFCDNANRLNEITGGQLLPPAPYVIQFIRGKFILKQDFCDSPFILSPDPEFLRLLIHK